MRQAFAQDVSDVVLVRLEQNAEQLAAAERRQLKIDVDRILDKINSTGLRSLTPAEKSILDRAKNQLSGT